MVTFNSKSVRWALDPDRAEFNQPGSDRSLGGHLARDRYVGRDTLLDSSPPAVPTPPPIPRDTPAGSKGRDPARDTVMDQRAPVHLSPLVRRGVQMPRETSHVRWLRQLAS